MNLRALAIPPISLAFAVLLTISILPGIAEARRSAAKRDAGTLAQWLRRADLHGPLTPRSALPAVAVSALEQAARESIGESEISVAWARVIARKRRRPTLLLTYVWWARSEGEPAARAWLLLLRVERKGPPETLDRIEVPRPNLLTWQDGPRPQLDGDRRADQIMKWSYDSGTFAENGLVVARTGPPALTLVRLGRRSGKAGAAEAFVGAPVACFAPYFGGEAPRARARSRKRRRARPPASHLLVVHRRHLRSGGRGRSNDSLEILVPTPDGRFAQGDVYAAILSERQPEGTVLHRWRSSFATRRTEPDPAAQAGLDICPAPVVVIPIGAVGGEDDGPEPLFTMLGPFATSEEEVRSAVLQRSAVSPKALMVVRLGH